MPCGLSWRAVEGAHIRVDVILGREGLGALNGSDGHVPVVTQCTNSWGHALKPVIVVVGASQGVLHDQEYGFRVEGSIETLVRSHVPSSGRTG